MRVGECSFDGDGVILTQITELKKTEPLSILTRRGTKFMDLIVSMNPFHAAGASDLDFMSAHRMVAVL